MFRFKQSNNHKDLDLKKCKNLPEMEGFVFKL